MHRRMYEQQNVWKNEWGIQWTITCAQCGKRWKENYLHLIQADQVQSLYAFLLVTIFLS